MEADDPRHAWAAQNQVALQQRAQAEASKKVEALAKAKEHLEKVNKVRMAHTQLCAECEIRLLGMMPLL
jgi:hypothetical protein